MGSSQAYHTGLFPLSHSIGAVHVDPAYTHTHTHMLMPLRVRGHAHACVHTHLLWRDINGLTMTRIRWSSSCISCTACSWRYCEPGCRERRRPASYFRWSNVRRPRKAISGTNCSLPSRGHVRQIFRSWGNCPGTGNGGQAFCRPCCAGSRSCNGYQGTTACRRRTDKCLSWSWHWTLSHTLGRLSHPLRRPDSWAGRCPCRRKAESCGWPPACWGGRQDGSHGGLHQQVSVPGPAGSGHHGGGEGHTHLHKAGGSLAPHAELEQYSATRWARQ